MGYGYENQKLCPLHTDRAGIGFTLKRPTSLLGRGATGKMANRISVSIEILFVWLLVSLIIGDRQDHPKYDLPRDGGRHAQHLCRLLQQQQAQKRQERMHSEYR